MPIINFNGYTAMPTSLKDLQTKTFCLAKSVVAGIFDISRTGVFNLKKCFNLTKEVDIEALKDCICTRFLINDYFKDFLVHVDEVSDTQPLACNSKVLRVSGVPFETDSLNCIKKIEFSLFFNSSQFNQPFFISELVFNENGVAQELLLPELDKVVAAFKKILKSLNRQYSLNFKLSEIDHDYVRKLYSFRDLVKKLAQEELNEPVTSWTCGFYPSIAPCVFLKTQSCDIEFKLNNPAYGSEVIGLENAPVSIKVEKSHGSSIVFVCKNIKKVDADLEQSLVKVFCSVFNP